MLEENQPENIVGSKDSNPITIGEVNTAANPITIGEANTDSNPTTIEVGKITFKKELSTEEQCILADKNKEYKFYFDSDNECRVTYRTGEAVPVELLEALN